MNEQLQIILGDSKGDHVCIAVRRREFPDANDADDANWVDSLILIQAGAWRGSFRAWLRTDDFPEFRQQLVTMYLHLPGEAKFATMEGWLALTVTGDKLGRVQVEGKAIDEPGIGNVLQFHFNIDQSYLPVVIRQLEDIEAAYPSR